jgi:dolichol-phosphate mannosyltransferase
MPTSDFMENPLISVVIPAFNEADNIGHVLNGIHKVLGKIGFPYGIMVVDDGSTTN